MFITGFFWDILPALPAGWCIEMLSPTFSTMFCIFNAWFFFHTIFFAFPISAKLKALSRTSSQQVQESPRGGVKLGSRSRTPRGVFGEGIVFCGGLYLEGGFILLFCFFGVTDHFVSRRSWWLWWVFRGWGAKNLVLGFGFGLPVYPFWFTCFGALRKIGGQKSWVK